MDDLISRQAVLKNIEKIRQGVQMLDDTHRADIIMSGMYLCEQAVMNQPSAQPERSHWVEVRWEDDSGNISSIWACHNCGSKLFYKSHYCPNCGADMRGEQYGLSD